MKKGFTLIELLVVFGIIITLGTIGLFYYRNYGRRQTVAQAAETVKTYLTQIRQKALAGEFIVDCPTSSPYSLTSYEFSYSTTPGQNQSFDIIQKCTYPSAPDFLKTAVPAVPLPKNVTFTSTSTSCGPTVDFYTLGHGTSINTPSGSCTIDLTGFGFSYSVTIDQSGNVE